MCYHNSMSKSASRLKARFDAKIDGEKDFEPIYHTNGFAHLPFPVITAEKPDTVQFFEWGLVPSFIKSKEQAEAFRRKVNTLNAKCETIFELASYKGSLEHKRCLVPSTGFYESQDFKGKKYPYFISLAETDIFCMAGVYSNWTDMETGEVFNTFTIITTAANPLMERIHNVMKRMPVILDPSSEREWIKPELEKKEYEQTWIPFDEGRMRAYTVSRGIFSKTEYTNVPEAQIQYQYPELKIPKEEWIQKTLF